MPLEGRQGFSRHGQNCCNHHWSLSDKGDHLRGGILSSCERFPEEVCRKLGNYVYRLIDPRNGEIFYVGKGRNNRVFDHAAGLPNVADDDTQQLGAKLDRSDRSRMQASR